MKWKSRAVEFGVGGAGGVAVCLFFVLLRSHQGITAGDWLSFFGVFIGGALGVVAGMAVERWKQGQQTASSLASLRTAFDNLIAGLDGFKAYGQGQTGPTWQQSQRHFFSGLMVLELWVQRNALDDIDLWADVINFYQQMPGETSSERRYARNESNDTGGSVPPIDRVASFSRLGLRTLDQAHAIRKRL